MYLYMVEIYTNRETQKTHHALLFQRKYQHIQSSHSTNVNLLLPKYKTHFACRMTIDKCGMTYLNSGLATLHYTTASSITPGSRED